MDLLIVINYLSLKNCLCTRPFSDVMVSKMFCLFLSSLFFLFVSLIIKELAITSDEALSLEDMPKRAVILGGG